MPKTFVIDTNVALHDSNFLTSFQENDLVIPMSVLEELGKFVTGTSAINHHARETLKRVDSLSTTEMFNGGASLGIGLGKLRIRRIQTSAEVDKLYPETVPENRLLSVCLNLKDELKTPVILVTKKVHLRTKARSMGIKAEDYTTDRAPLIFRSEPLIEEVSQKTIDEVFSGKRPFVGQNGYTILKSTDSNTSCLCFKGEPIRPQTVQGIRPKNAQQTFALHALCDPTVNLVTLTGPAGTGKTLMALASGIENRHQYRQILIVRPLVTMGNMGFLPGSMEDKLDPYMQPIRDNLQVLGGDTENKGLIDKMLKEEKIRMEPLPYIRGRSIVKCFVIVDESQNLTAHEIKTIITRAGEGTKFVFTGDIHQIDNEYLDEYTNGLSVMIHRLRGESIHRHVNLIQGERSVLSEIASRLL